MIISEDFDKLIKELQNNAAPKELNLSEKKLSHEQIVQFCNALRTNISVTHLNLSWTSFGEVETKYLSEALKGNKTLVELDLSCNDLTADCAMHLSQVIRENKTLLNLDLSANNLSAEGAKHISKALIENSTLIHLDLQENDITALGAKYLAKALKENKTLLQLDLYDNNLRDVGAIHLSEALKVNKTLLELDLGWNKLSAVGLKHLVEALKYNKTLKHLPVLNSLTADNVYHMLTEDNVKDLIDCLKNNYSLLTLENWYIKNKSQEIEIQKLLQRNIDYPKEQQNTVAFLMGLHHRLGTESSVKQHLKNSPIFEREVLDEMFSFMTGKQSKNQNKSLFNTNEEKDSTAQTLIFADFGQETKKTKEMKNNDPKVNGLEHPTIKKSF